MTRKGPEKRTPRISSPKYRIFLGKKLREYRENAGYTLNDISEMTSIPVNTLLSIEKGKTTNIDYYVEYAKSVAYPFENLVAAEIDLIPTYSLPETKKQRIRLTLNIRKHILKSNFLKGGKTVDQIIGHLEHLEAVPKGEVGSVEVAGVMQNFIKDESVKVARKVGGKNLYVLNDAERA